jgi:hypothetical protein
MIMIAVIVPVGGGDAAGRFPAGSSARFTQLVAVGVLAK